MGRSGRRIAPLLRAFLVAGLSLLGAVAPGAAQDAPPALVLEPYTLRGRAIDQRESSARGGMTTPERLFIRR